MKHAGLPTMNDFTLTFVNSEGHPREFLKMIRLRSDLQLEENIPVQGIHQIRGMELPVQVLVLDALTEPRDIYMFAPFLTRKKPIRLDATKMLLSRRLNHPDNPYVRELVDFKLRNEIMTEEEMEVFAQMVTQMSTAERARAREILKNSVLGREMIDEGKIEGKQEVIQEFLLRRFAVDSSDLQKEVRKLKDPEILSKVLMDLYAANSLEEARAIIAGSLSENSRL